MKTMSIKSALLIVLLSVSTAIPLYSTTKRVESAPSKKTTIQWVRTKVIQTKNVLWGQKNFKHHYLRRLLLLASTTISGIALYLQKTPLPASMPGPKPFGPLPAGGQMPLGLPGQKNKPPLSKQLPTLLPGQKLNSITCPKCSLNNAIDANDCVVCGQTFNMA